MWHDSASIPQQTSRPWHQKRDDGLACTTRAYGRGVLLFPVHNLSPELFADVVFPGEFAATKVLRRSQPGDSIHLNKRALVLRPASL